VRIEGAVPALNNDGHRLIPAIIAENKQVRSVASRTFRGEPDVPAGKKLLARHSLVLIAVGQLKTIKRLPTSRYDQWRMTAIFTNPAPICNAGIHVNRAFLA